VSGIFYYYGKVHTVAAKFSATKYPFQNPTETNNEAASASF